MVLPIIYRCAYFTKMYLLYQFHCIQRTDNILCLFTALIYMDGQMGFVSGVSDMGCERTHKEEKRQRVKVAFTFPREEKVWVGRYAPAPRGQGFGLSSGVWGWSWSSWRAGCFPWAALVSASSPGAGSSVQGLVVVL